MIHKDYRFRAHQRQRVIRKRLHIIRNAWGYRDGEPNGLIALEQPGRLSKYNLNCGCWMCQLNKTGKDIEPFDWRIEDAA